MGEASEHLASLTPKTDVGEASEHLASLTPKTPKTDVGDAAVHPASAEEEDVEDGMTKRLTDTFARSDKRTKTLARTISAKDYLQYGVHSIQNTRKEMEDAHEVKLGLAHLDSEARLLPVDDVTAALGSVAFFSVFDGHGGTLASEFCSERVVAILVADPALSEAPEETLRRTLLKTEEEWLTKAHAEELFDGTTAAVVLVDTLNRRVTVGNIGDSEVVRGTRDAAGEMRFSSLTEVHNVKQNEAEAARVVAVGGRVVHGRLGHPKLNPRVCSLAVSRAIGDNFFKDDEYTSGTVSGLTADPYITSAVWEDGDVAEQIIIIGCDGLWDTVSHKMAIDLAFEQKAAGETPQAISEALVKLAQETGSSDNITVVVVVF